MSEILVVNNAEPGIREFAEPILKLISEAGSTPTFIEYAACPTANLNAFDGIILTGSPQGDDIVEHHAPYFEWIKDFEKPVLGICAGHHVTGYLYGSELLRSQEPESGDFEVEIVKADPLFNELPQKFTVRQMHNDSITLPNDFELLVTSATCKNQLMKHKNKPLYTSQFHPEFYNHQLIRNFIALCE
ncbi:type 1 glutamine amidotransferase [uncultured Draconibacterium sp.]|uniref:type 1 glutamine amidotransferase n=1 Tax=uncultured Draconibacterium sp. TaxID=1573823 RepID=UPI0025E6681A|nr:homoserine O-succinyltransferase [uncultured Draconibacterium sp.]